MIIVLQDKVVWDIKQNFDMTMAPVQPSLSRHSKTHDNSITSLAIEHLFYFVLNCRRQQIAQTLVVVNSIFDLKSHPPCVAKSKAHSANNP